MGAIIGTAIGSAIGASVAPKKGLETRSAIKDKAEEAGKLTKETAKGFFKLAKNLLFGKTPVKKKTQKSAQKPHEMKQIPTETDKLPN